MDANPSIGLTEEQRQLLQTAVENGYFAVPRETTLTEIGNEHALSSQEASECLRYGLNTIVSERMEE